ncbi:hypothetical protein P0136_13025 [Lentisphaerota bacterium ZTH]|nr:hypothetical protein JYG24_09460 [Lentisphaerota bacterium]WET06281.1 hypothetical protein P0136_13025 [Lentisphaerota bacterium ZTH]
MIESRTRKIYSGDWQAEFMPKPETILCFSFEGKEVMRLQPALINTFDEQQGVVRKVRTHIRQDGFSSKFDAETVIPFGSEPSIKRSGEFADGFAKVIMDVQPGTHDPVRYLKTDTIVLSGPWKKIAVCRIPNAGAALPVPEWLELSEEGFEIFDASYPFLNCILENADGFRFEVGLGDDLWRWNSAAALELCSGNFKISGSAQEITIERTPVIFDQDTRPDKRSWRFKWYFAWSKTPAAGLLPADAVTINTTEQNVPAAANNSSAKGVTCQMSAAARRAFRKVLRSGFAAAESKVFALTNIEPHICNTASHLDRPGSVSLAHWDLWDLMELFLWGNRKAVQHSDSLLINPPLNSNSGEYPAVAALSRPPSGEISAE